MNQIELIRAEIERLRKDRSTPRPGKWYEGYYTALRKLSSFLDTLKEQPVKGPFTGEQIYKFLKEQQGFPNWHPNPLEEQPVDLEKEIKRVLEDTSFRAGIDSGGFTTTVLDYQKIARHFFNLGQQSKQTGFPTTDEEMEEFLATHPKVEAPDKYKTPDWLFKQEQPACEGLEEEIERYLHSLGVGYGGWVDGMEDDDLRGIARHFAQWQREQDNVISRQAESTRIKTQQMCYEKGQADMKRLMMKEAVEGIVHYFGETQGVPRSITIPQMQKWLKPFGDGDKVKLIIIKDD